MKSKDRNIDHDIPGVLISEKGQLRFTADEKPRVRRYLAHVGINIDNVRTLDDYVRARKLAASHFLAWLVSEIASKPSTEERQKLLDALTK